jgi:Flp pilus assembly protein TadD
MSYSEQQRRAVALRPQSPEARLKLGAALFDEGDLDGAIAEYREAIRLQPDHAHAHCSLAGVLAAKGDVDGAIAECREAIRLAPDFAGAHNNLGGALLGTGDVDGAIAAFRQALRLKPDYAEAHNNLGVALERNWDVDGAIAAFRQALRLKPDYTKAHLSLAQSLGKKGQFAEALTYFRRGHDLGSKNPLWPYPSAKWVRDCERLVELEAELPRLLKGDAHPANVGERLALAGICCLPGKSFYAAAVRFNADAFAEQPQLADDLQAGLRYNAACLAALAGCGQGQDAGGLPEKDSVHLRTQALKWLRADLDAWRGLLEKDPDKAAPVVAQRMRHWLDEPDFNGVRDPNALAKLTEAERQGWQQLWADVQRQLDRGADKPPQPTDGDKRP